MGLFNNKPKTNMASLCLTIVLGGEAGEGIKSAGNIISQTLLKKGMNVFLYDEYPSLIRGGHNAVYITYSPYPVYSTNREIDILVCLDKNTFDIHKKDLNTSSIVIYDHESFLITDEDLRDLPCELVDIPVRQIIKKNNFPQIVQNIIFLSVSMNVLGITRATTDKAVKKALGKKIELLETNLKAIEKAYDASTEYSSIKKIPDKGIQEKGKSYFMTGNDAISIGAISAGMNFYAAYPMTPSSTVLDFMSAHFREYNLIVKQAEDEISAINMGIGASYAGARAMVGTSGGGFSLMVEALGLAAITETPLVILLSQRPGPATGLPTWTGQGDLLFALHASQDEFPRVIFTPTDQEEAMELTFQAFNIADKFQLPVIVLSDKYLSESLGKFMINKPGKKIDRGLMIPTRALMRLDKFERYEITKNGISSRSIPGQEGGTYIANSDESDTRGFSDETSANRKAKVEKRYAKLKSLQKELPNLNVYGDIRAKLCLVTWGSTKGAALEATRRLQNMGVSLKLLALNYIEPFPVEEVTKFLSSSKSTLLIEGNYLGQLGQLIKLHTGFNVKNKLLKYDGRPIYPDEIVNKVLEITR